MSCSPVPRVFSESDAVLMKLCFKHYNEGLEVIFNRFQNHIGFKLLELLFAHKSHPFWLPVLDIIFIEFDTLR